MNKIELNLKVYGEPILRKKTKPVLNFNSALEDIFEKMIEIMHNNAGVGLAATQVGLDKQIMVIDVGSGVHKITNPQIIEREGEQAQEEGCLSLPGVTVNVKRADKIVLRYKDEKGIAQEIDCSGLLSRAIQHEIDHLQGKLIIDYLPWIKRLSLRKKLEEIKKRSHNERMYK